LLFFIQTTSIETV